MAANVFQCIPRLVQTTCCTPYRVTHRLLYCWKVCSRTWHHEGIEGIQATWKLSL